MNRIAVLLFFLILVTPMVLADCSGNTTTCFFNNDTLQCSAQQGCYWTPTNNADNSFNNLAMIMVLIGMATMFVVVGNSMKEKKWLMKSSMYFISLLLMLISIGIGIQIAWTKNLNLLMTSAFIIGVVSVSMFLIFIVVNYLTEVVKAVRNSKKEKESSLD